MFGQHPDHLFPPNFSNFSNTSLMFQTYHRANLCPSSPTTNPHHLDLTPHLPSISHHYLALNMVRYHADHVQPHLMFCDLIPWTLTLGWNIPRTMTLTPRPSGPRSFSPIILRTYPRYLKRQQPPTYLMIHTRHFSLPHRSLTCSTKMTSISPHRALNLTLLSTITFLRYNCILNQHSRRPRRSINFLSTIPRRSNTSHSRPYRHRCPSLSSCTYPLQYLLTRNLLLLPSFALRALTHPSNNTPRPISRNPHNPAPPTAHPGSVKYDSSYLLSHYPLFHPPQYNRPPDHHLFLHLQSLRRPTLTLLHRRKQPPSRFQQFPNLTRPPHRWTTLFLKE